MSKHKIYLGDSVYADVDGFGGIVLTTENGLGPSNTIIMEPEVLSALQQWLAGMRRAAPTDKTEEDESWQNE